MGNDGAAGMLEMHRAGAHTRAERGEPCGVRHATRGDAGRRRQRSGRVGTDELQRMLAQDFRRQAALRI